MRTLNRIIIHCSATPNFENFTIEQIRKWHIEERNWKDIGYHYVIEVSGEIKEGRPLSKVGAHCEGFNSDSVGICLIGTDEFTPNQWISLDLLLTRLMNTYSIKDVKGHNEYNPNKTCPGFNVQIYMNKKLN